MKKILIGILSLAFVFVFLSFVVNANRKTGNDYQTYIEKAKDCVYKEKNLDKALSNINKAIEIKKDYASAYFTKAGIEMIKGEYEQAINDYEIYKKYDPKHDNQANFFIDLAKEALSTGAKANFNKFNIALSVDDGETLEPNEEEKTKIFNAINIQGYYDANITALNNFCKDTGYIPQKFFKLFEQSYSGTMNNKDKLMQGIRKEYYYIIQKTGEENIENAFKTHNKDYEEIKLHFQEENKTFTKKDYCAFFDEEAKSIVKTRIDNFKKNRPDLFK